MDRWLGAHFLLAGLLLSSSAPTDEQCESLVALQPQDVPSTVGAR